MAGGDSGYLHGWSPNRAQHLAQQHKQHTSRLLLLLDRDHLLLLLFILLCQPTGNMVDSTLACCPLSNSLLQPLERQSLVLSARRRRLKSS